MPDIRIGRATYGPRVSLHGDTQPPLDGEAPDFWGVYLDEPADPTTGIARAMWAADVATEPMALVVAAALTGRAATALLAAFERNRA